MIERKVFEFDRMELGNALKTYASLESQDVESLKVMTDDGEVLSISMIMRNRDS